MSTEEHYDAIVIGAGVVGPCLAKVLAGQGRKVLIVEREWSKPNRIVGELMQPSGLLALKRLGMAQAVNNINAIQTVGYYISFFDKNLKINYPEKSILMKNKININPVPGALTSNKLSSDKLITDETLNMDDWEKSPFVRGVALHHGDFLMNLRSICLNEPNVTKLDGNVTKIIEKNGRVTGIEVADKGIFNASLVFSCDGIYSKFRKELSKDYIPSIGSYFIGLDLVDANLPAKYHGHVILGNHAPVLIYQISPHHSRILCAYRSNTLPKRNDVLNYLSNEVLPNLPNEIKPCFQKSYEESFDGSNIYKAMPNQFLTARLNDKPGFICLGDSLNMRHPLTGGGMTVGLNDCALMCEILSTLSNDELKDHSLVFNCMKKFHNERKGLDVVINTLSIALYTLFAADSSALTILQRGCFYYFLRGGECVNGPISLLSGLCPSSLTLFNHFFSVAFYSCYLNFIDRGFWKFPLAIWENIQALTTACFVLLPLLSKEIFS